MSEASERYLADIAAQEAAFDEGWDGVTARDKLIQLIKERMVVSANDITTSAGEQTKTYLDIPGVLHDSAALHLAARVLREHLLTNRMSSKVTAIGGPTTGAIPLVTSVAMTHWNRDFRWFIVRDKVKDHGLGRMFVGAQPRPGDKIIVTDDVVSTGRSLAVAAFRIQQTGAELIAVAPLVDRGTKGSKQFERVFKGVAYLPVLTHTDLDLPPLC